MTDQTLNVKITGDASGFDAATASAAKSLDTLKANVDKLDAETIEITPELQVDRLNRDLANLKKVLARIEAQKANPDVGLDLTRLLADEKKVEGEISRLESQRATIEADLDVNTTGLAELRAGLTGAIAGGGGIEGLQAGLAGLSDRPDWRNWPGPWGPSRSGPGKRRRPPPTSKRYVCNFGRVRRRTTGPRRPATVRRRDPFSLNETAQPPGPSASPASNCNRFRTG
jgi:hypothetical protein